MKKTLTIFITVIFIFAVCGCAVHKDPLGEYAKLEKKDDADGITRLVDDLLRAKDYQNAGAVLTEVGKNNTASLYKYKYDQMQKSFAGHETAVGMDAWSCLYNSAIVSYINKRKTVENQLELMRTYHDLLFLHFKDTQTALAHVGDQQYLELKEPEGEFSSQFGKAAKGKALIYIAPRYGLKEEEVKLGLSACLPDPLLPSSLGEVEYVVSLHYTTQKVGTYTNNGAAERVLLEISVVHYPDGKVLKTYPTIEGSDPPKTITVTKGDKQGRSGHDPDGAAMAPVLAEAFDYIAGLQ